jgi:TonB family protein
MLNVHVNRSPLTVTARAVAVVALLIVTLPIAGFGAQTYAKVTGTLADQFGGVLPDATLTLSNVETRAKYEVHSDRAGQFEFVGLPAGDYALDARLPGFSTLHDTLTLTAGQSARRAFTLEVGHLTETLLVVDSPPDGSQPPARVARVDSRKDSCGSGAPAGGAAIGGNIRPPVQLVRVTPQYPPQLRGTNVQGTVVLELRIGVDGAIREVRPSTTTPAANSDLEQAAMAALNQWQFSPTLLNCVPVEVNMTAYVKFVPKP